MPQSTYKRLLCLVCNVRKRRYINGTCDPCRALTNAEGTHELYGLQTESKKRTEYREFAKVYNAMARKGMTQPEIATAMGLDKTYVTRLVYRVKSAGIPVVVLTKRPLGAPIPKPSTKKILRTNDHGTGRWGKRGCSCDACLEVRRETRKELAQIRAAAGLPPRQH